MSDDNQPPETEHQLTKGILMHASLHVLGALALSALLAVAPALSNAKPQARPVADFTVFVDPPTGFVFVKLPAGWKFVGTVDADDVRQLPAGVVTDLLDFDADDPQRLTKDHTKGALRQARSMDGVVRILTIGAEK